MQPIDIGDLSLDLSKATRQSALFHAIREKIVRGFWSKGNKLPSTRKLAIELDVSRNTVIFAYEQLMSEGYIESRKGAGYFVSIEQPEHYLAAPEPPVETEGLKGRELSESIGITPFDVNQGFAPGVPDLRAFPFAKWQRLLQRHVTRLSLAGNQQVQGSIALREALSHYLASSRSVHCDPSRIIITVGAQQALSMALMATLKTGDEVLMEEPGYRQVHKIIDLLQLKMQPVPVREKQGLCLDKFLASQAQALYVTPSNQYPMGTTLTTEQRLKIIDWAKQNQAWIIEDDYDSEFQFAHRPYTSMQGLAGKLEQDERVIYVGSLSKVMFNGLRIGYMVVPKQLVPRCLEVKDAITGDSPTHTQEALADFINEGDLLRHIRKMRRSYKQKYEAMLTAIESEFGQDLEVISQAAGLHVTVKWYGGISEHDWSRRAERENIVVRPFSFYEYAKDNGRDWRSVVLGFGNVPLNEIPQKMRTIAQAFYHE
jgi:GntR family transcriptional regulator/MocR family aminotransferase